MWRTDRFRGEEAKEKTIRNFCCKPFTTTNKTFGSISNDYSSKIDADSVVLAKILESSTTFSKP
jgi:hypothetical protein